MSQKRGQLTLIIIIVLILVIGVALVFTVTRLTREAPPPPIEIEPVLGQLRDFASECLHITAEAAVKKLGEHGGYVDPTDRSLTRPILKFGAEAVESDVLELADGSGVWMPYWYYLKSPTICTDCLIWTRNIPRKEDMEDQLVKTIEKNLPDCLGTFERFQEQGFRVTATEPKATVTLTEQDVVAEVSQEIRATRGEAEVVLNEYTHTVDVPLLRILRLALSIVKAEREKQFLESGMLHLIGIFSGVESAKLPPISAVTHGERIVTWNKFMVNQQLESLLFSYVPLFRVNKTLMPPLETSSEIELGVINGLMVDIDEEAPDTQVRFYYTGWPFFFDITPRSGDVLGPNIDKRKFPLGIADPSQSNTYEFYYDLSYPIAIELHHPSALSNEGYSFFFAMEGNIRNNKNTNEWLRAMEPLVLITRTATPSRFPCL